MFRHQIYQRLGKQKNEFLKSVEKQAKDIDLSSCSEAKGCKAR